MSRMCSDMDPYIVLPLKIGIGRFFRPFSCHISITKAPEHHVQMEKKPFIV